MGSYKYLKEKKSTNRRLKIKIKKALQLQCHLNKPKWHYSNRSKLEKRKKIKIQ